MCVWVEKGASFRNVATLTKSIIPFRDANGTWVRVILANEPWDDDPLHPVPPDMGLICQIWFMDPRGKRPRVVEVRGEQYISLSPYAKPKVSLFKQ